LPRERQPALDAIGVAPGLEARDLEQSLDAALAVAERCQIHQLIQRAFR
jgi:hypothetical protein